MNDEFTKTLIPMIEGWESRVEDARRQAEQARACYQPTQEAGWEGFAQGLEECALRLRQKLEGDDRE